VAAAPTQRGLPTVGTVINGKYRLDEIIGEGGIGVVIAATHLELGDKVALKFLRPEMLSKPDLVGRFVFEAKAASAIKSDHSASVFDVGRTEDGIPFLVMEFLEGHDLASVIAKGPLEGREVAEYGMHTCEALASAHAKGLIHRDIKPENLFIELRAGLRSIKVLDFGISKLSLTGAMFDTPVVKTQSLMGTPLYMSPEQVRTPDNIDARSDIYSLGVVLYEALTGTLPSQGATITELCTAILEQPITPVARYRPDLPEGFGAVVEKCLAKDPALRYQNAAEVAVALMAFAPKRARICAERAGEILVAAGLASPEDVRFASEAPPSGAFSGAFRLPPPAPLPSHAAGVLTSETLPEFTIEKPKQRWWPAVLGLAVVLGVGAFLIVQGEHVPRPPPPPVVATAAPPPEMKLPEAIPTVTATVTAVQSATSAAPPPIAPRPVVIKAVKKATPLPEPQPSSTPENKVDALDIGY
jgi:serine/threonine-protein kinase